MDLTEFFCEIDDFCQDWLSTFSSTFFSAHGNSLPKCCRLSLSEVMTISIHFHQSSYRTFKDYYIKYVCQHLTNYTVHGHKLRVLKGERGKGKGK